jgi:hypothetical protein
MTIFNVKLKERKHSWADDYCPFSDYEIEDLGKLNLDHAWYWYAYGSYEGDGAILMLKDGKWNWDSLGHCSCYGPTDNLAFNPSYDSLDDLLSHCSDYAKEDLALLVEAAKAHQDQTNESP